MPRPKSAACNTLLLILFILCFFYVYSLNITFFQFTITFKCLAPSSDFIVDPEGMG
ncbi:secreted protein [gut metagenome]|uniref:Secreted protein n=1 Tax=gut metagenome TaxID=749906 RepID=J9GEB4_9ZZZZ